MVKTIPYDGGEKKHNRTEDGERRTEAHTKTGMTVYVMPVILFCISPQARRTAA